MSHHFLNWNLGGHYFTGSFKNKQYNVTDFSQLSFGVALTFSKITYRQIFDFRKKCAHLFVAPNAVKINDLALCSLVCAENCRGLQISEYQIISPPSHNPDVFLSYAKTRKDILNKRPVRCSSIFDNVKNYPI